MDVLTEELREAYASGELVAFVGAGLSRAAGLPSLRELVDHLLVVARSYGLHPSQIEELEELALTGRAPDALSELESTLTAAAFTRAVTRALDDQERQLPELARGLAELTNLRGILTTNLDRLIERALEGRWPCYVRPVASLARARGWIYKLHGTLPECDTWVLTRDQYRRVAYNEALHQRLIEALFLATPLLFVGCELDDPDIVAVLDRIRALASQQPPNHFALVDEARLNSSYRRRLAETGIRAIPYENSDGEHAQCVRLLRSLHDRSGSFSTPSRG